MGICRACGEAFWVCPGCDRYGEIGYCEDEGCKLVGRELIVQRAQRRYRESPEGQAQHCDEERARRQRRPGRRGRRARSAVSRREGTDVQVVGDPPPSLVASGASSCARNAALTSTLEAATACAPGTSDDESTDRDVGPPSGRDAALDDGGPRRTDAGRARPGDESAPASGFDTSRGACAVAPAGAVRCAVCRRWGRYVGTSAGRRVGFWRQERALRSRGGPARARAPSAPPRDAG